MRLLNNRSLAFMASLLFSVLGGVTLLTNTSYAAVVGFDAGNIMSDVVFTDYRSLDATGIQNFLNAKGVYCSGSLCLKNYKQGSRSSAQIIYAAAQQYKINPKVLIVLVQKEVGLVTDTAPQSWQYKTATGYGCPDTAACDSQYYGFTNQINWAAKMYRAIMNQSPTWYTPYSLGNNRIYYHPDLSRCGYKTVNITNLTTVALYSYTPYQPNKAALNAGYGIGDSCSSYGNRNFYQYFKDWFGSPTIPSVFRTSSSDQAYLLSGNSYLKIPSVSVLNAYGYDTGDIKEVSSHTLTLLSDGGTAKRISRFDGGSSIYILDKGRKFHFPGPSMYSLYGYTMGDETDLDASVSVNLPDGGDVSELINQTDDGKKFLVEGAKKRHISGTTAYTTLGSPVYSTRRAVNLSASYTATLAGGTPILAPNSFARDTNDANSAGFWDGSNLQPFSPNVLADAAMPMVSEENVHALPKTTSPTIGQLVKTSATDYYIFDTGQIFHLSPSDVTASGLTETRFQSANPAILTNVTAKVHPYIPAVRVNNSNEIYILGGQHRTYVTSRAALSERGYIMDQVANINSRTALLFPVASSRIYATGSLLRLDGKSEIYLVSGTASMVHVPSRTMLETYGFSFDQIMDVSSAQASGYSKVGDANYFVKDSVNNVWLIDSGGTKRKLSTTLQSASYYNLTVASLPTYSDTLLAKFPSKQDMTQVVKIAGQSKVFKIDNGTKRWITGPSAMARLGYTTASIRDVSPAVLGLYASGADIR